MARNPTSGRISSWTPKNLNPAFWADPSQSGTLSLTGTTINSITDAAGSGKVLTKGAGGVTLDSTNLLNGLPSIQLGNATNATLRSTTGSGISGNAQHSLHFIGDFNIDPASGYQMTMACGPENGSQTVASVLGQQHLNYMGDYGKLSTTRYDSLPHILSIDYSSRQCWMYIDGFSISTSAYNTILNITDDSFSIGYSAGGVYTCAQSRIRECIFPGRLTSAAERGALTRYWVNKYNLALTAPNIYFRGDSITFGLGVTPGVTDWVTVGMTALNATRTAASKTTMLFTNGGVSGETALNMANTFGAIPGVVVAPSFNYSGRRKETFVLMAGTNDIINGGTTMSAQKIYEDLIRTCLQAYEQGYDKVVLCTVVIGATTAGLYDSTREPVRLALNALIRTAVANGVCDALLDFDANAGLIYPTDYADTLHPGVSGNVKMANLMAPFLYSLTSSF